MQHEESFLSLQWKKMKVKINNKKIKILALDCEARPLSWLSQDYVTKEITAIAAKFLDEDKVYCWALGETETSEFLLDFCSLYEEAEMVTGHFLRSYDLPLINSALAEFWLPPLESKLAHDTKSDLINMQGVSKSQENLSTMFELEEDKVNMSNTDWREANRLTEEGIAKTKDRVISDIHQQIKLREKLLEYGYLGPPKIWKSVGYRNVSYTP